MSSLQPQEAKRVALYARVSSEDQAERGTIQGQLDFLRQFVQLYSLDVASEYVDNDLSGILSMEQQQ